MRELGDGVCDWECDVQLEPWAMTPGDERVGRPATHSTRRLMRDKRGCARPFGGCRPLQPWGDLRTVGRMSGGLGLKVTTPTNQLRNGRVEVAWMQVDGKMYDMKFCTGEQDDKLLQDGRHCGSD